MSRRSPIRHRVRDHERGGRPVREYERGSGSPRSREHVVVRNEETTEEPTQEITPMVVEEQLISHPVEALVTEVDQGWEEYDVDALVMRPTGYKMVIRTKEEVYGFDNEAWADAARNVFGTFEYTEQAGYKISNVDISRKLYTTDMYEIMIWMKKER